MLLIPGVIHYYLQRKSPPLKRRPINIIVFFNRSFTYLQQIHTIDIRKEKEYFIMNTHYTCKYCGTTLSERLTCNFCEIGFSLDSVCKDKERSSQIPYEIPILGDENEVLNRSTIDLLSEKTLTLYYLLKIARKSKDTAFRAHEEEKVAVLIKKIYIIENIIFEREGVFPKAMNDSVLKRKRKEIIEFETYLRDKNKYIMK